MGVKLLLREIYLSLTNHPGNLSLAIPPWVSADMVLFAGDMV